TTFTRSCWLVITLDASSRSWLVIRRGNTALEKRDGSVGGSPSFVKRRVEKSQLTFFFTEPIRREALAGISCLRLGAASGAFAQRNALDPRIVRWTPGGNF